MNVEKVFFSVFNNSQACVVIISHNIKQKLYNKTYSHISLALLNFYAIQLSALLLHQK